jgi:hypothetical protein
MSETDDFYIGWQSRASTGTGRFAGRAVKAICLFIIGLACILAIAQKTIGRAVFEWGMVKPFKGVLLAEPYPRLLVNRPGRSDGQSAYWLVAPFKFGLKSESLTALNGKMVSLRGTLIYRGSETMIEAQPDSIKEIADSSGSFSPPGVTNLGRRTLVGEIVDSKCYLGVMNPGRLTTHRGCAVRCISGGIPPILLVRQQAGPPLYFLLTSSDGRPVNKQVLDMVAEPVEITGEVIRQGDLCILRADPSTYRRVTTRHS